MVDTKIGTSAEQPINSDGAVGDETFEEGDLVSLNGDGELVEADAESGFPAVGVSAVSVDDPSNYPDGQFEYAAKVAEANRALVGEDKLGFVKFGVEIVNNDEDWGFDPGEPVYLDEGGGYTQTEPSTADSVVQVVGSANPDGESVFLDIEPSYTVA